MSILTSVLTTAVELFTDEISQQEIAQTTEGLKKAMQKAYSSSPPTIDWHPGLNTRTTDTPAGYLTMTVTRIQLDKGRILWRERYPILNVECKVNAANQQARQYTTVIGGGTQDTAGNWAMADANILMQVPYQGGPVPLTVTLYSHPGKN